MKRASLYLCATAVFALVISADATLISLLKRAKPAPTLPPAREVRRDIIREVPLVKDVEIIKEILKEVPQEVIRRVPVDRIVYVDRPVEVLKEVIVDKIVPVDRPVEIIKEVTVEKVCSLQ